VWVILRSSLYSQKVSDFLWGKEMDRSIEAMLDYGKLIYVHHVLKK
jgi:hypothetical protein